MAESAPTNEEISSAPDAKAWTLARLGLAREIILGPGADNNTAWWQRPLLRTGYLPGLGPWLKRLFPSAFSRACKARAGGRRFLVPAPPVQTALELYAASKGALDGDEGDLAVVEDLLDRWLPAAVATYLAALPVEERIATAIDLADQGVLTTADKLKASSEALEEALESGEPPEDPFEKAGRIEWDVLLALYCTVYGGSPWEVYTETPWTVFLHLVGRIDQVTALEHLLDLDLALLPHLGEGAEEALNELRSRAGDPFGPKAKRQSLSEQRAAVEELRSIMGRR